MAMVNYKVFSKNFGLKRLNDLLTVFVLALGIYIMVSPFGPMLVNILKPIPKKPNDIVQVTASAPISSEPIKKANLLNIPRINLDETINTGTSINELNKGAWLVPGTSTPDKKSNTVIVGHRYTYSGQQVFYFLDKIQVNDRITVSWQGKEYTYKVSGIKVVSPSDVSVQDPTAKPQLTLYTCTPVFTSKDRLVITAPLVGVRS